MNEWSLPIHERTYREQPGYPCVVVELESGEKAVRVTFREPFVYGDASPYSFAKQQASQLLRKNYDGIRAIGCKMTDEKVSELTLAYRGRRRK